MKSLKILKTRAMGILPIFFESSESGELISNSIVALELS